MDRVIREIEGIWEDIVSRQEDLAGRQVRVQVLNGSRDIQADLRQLLKDTQRAANGVTDDEIDAEVARFRQERRCAS